MSTREPLSAFCILQDSRAARKKKNTLDVNDEIPIAGKLVLITGSNSGIGAAAALELAKRGARLLMPNRDMKKAQDVADSIKAKVPEADLTLLPLDLGDLDSVRGCAAEVRRLVPRIDVLINNAGIQGHESTLNKTKHGFESNMGVNYLGPFLFTNLLLDLVVAAGPGARILFTASALYQAASLQLDDIMLEKKGSFGSGNLGPYGNSKLANMYNAYSLSKRLAGKGVNTYALDPGPVKTDLRRDAKGIIAKIAAPIANMVMSEPEEGAEAILYCALSNKCAGETGLMYRCNGLWEGAMEGAVDEAAAEKL